MAVKRLLYLLSVFSFANLSPVLKDGYQIGCLKCHGVDDKKLNIHLVPHSHDDVGWLKTVDQYYYGLNNTIQYASVQYIITSVVDALLQNPDRRYMQVETAFFWKWWNDQTDDMRSKFKNLVDNGQIEMVNGAWSMNDEACTNYQSTIDQFAWGLRLINQTIGSCGTPRVGWQIDPFGHSREQASLFAQLGYDGLFFSRLDLADQLNRRKENTSEFVWQGSANLDNTAIFGSILPNGYGPPNGFCWDISCSDDPIDDGIYSPDNNVQTIRESFIKNMKEYSTYYRTKHVFLPMGEDFQYSAAEAYYINIDRLIKIFNNDSGINVLYSTPSCYIKAVNDAQPKLPLKSEDFFPYSSEEHSYWAGYFTSRPNSKRFERIGNNILQAAKQLYALASYNFTDSPYESNLRYLREAMGTFQHHDAITGTEKQHVANDYVRQLHRGIKKVEEGISSVIQNLIGIDDKTVHLELSTCLLANISICTVSQSSDKVLVLVYNPLSWNVSHYVRLPVENNNFTVKGPDGQEEYDLAPALSGFSFVKLTRETPSTHDLVFYAKNLPALGFKIYYIEKTKKNEGYTNQLMQANTNTFGWQNKYFTIDNKTHLLQSVYLNGMSLNITQNFYYYDSTTRDEFTFIKYIRDAPKSAVSGAYLFRPNNTEAVELRDLSSTYFNGSLVKEYWQKWKNTKMDITQIIRVYKDEDYIEFDWMVGNIIVGDNKTGKEVITRFAVFDEFNSSNTFYTDSNGRELIQRIKDQHSDYSYNASIEPVASNYYPITSKILIKDKKKNIEVAILNDRAQGGSSLKSGEIELMVHRRLFRDDYKGVGEPLNETEFGDVGIYVRGSHYLILGKASGANSNGLTTAAQERILAHKKLLQPWIMLSNTTKNVSDLEKIVNSSYPGLLNPLPDNVNVLTFEPWINNTYILRLENIFEKNEDSNLSTTSAVSLKNLFRNFAIKDFTEMTLGANTLLSEINKRQKYTWQLDDKSEVHFIQVEAASNMDITLTPMQIRTFIVTLKPLKHNFGFIIQPSLVLISMLLVVNLDV